MRIVAGSLKNRRLVSPAGDQTRPITDLIKGALFNVLAPRIEGCRFLDLFAGSGAVGLEAVSRGAGEVVWVERSPIALRALRENVRRLAPERVRSVVHAPVERFLTRAGSYDVIFADPPFASDPASFVRDVPPVLDRAGIFVLRYQARRVVVPPPGLAPRFEKTYGDSVLVGFEWTARELTTGSADVDGNGDDHRRET